MILPKRKHLKPRIVAFVTLHVIALAYESKMAQNYEAVMREI